MRSSGWGEAAKVTALTLLGRLRLQVAFWHPHICQAQSCQITFWWLQRTSHMRVRGDQLIWRDVWQAVVLMLPGPPHKQWVAWKTLLKCGDKRFLWELRGWVCVQFLGGTKKKKEEMVDKVQKVLYLRHWLFMLRTVAAAPVGTDEIMEGDLVL